MDDTWTYHPQADEQGQRLRLHAPSCEANLASLADPRADLTFIPGSACADLLNGVLLCRCPLPDLDAGVAPAVDEPPFRLPAGKRAAAGAVVIEPDGRLWLVAPSNGFGGYQATFPKGRVEPGIPLQATAVKEVWEESACWSN